MLFLFCALVLTGCQNSQTDSDEAYELFEKNPVTISWDEPVSGGIESFSADVERYTMNNRTDTATHLQSTYRMAVKIIGTVTYSRVDFTESRKSSRMKAVIMNDDSAVIVDSATGQIESRIDMSDDTSAELKAIFSSPALGRINISKIRQDAHRIALDMADEGDKLTINIPVGMLNNVLDERWVSSKIVFDTKNEIVAEVETVCIQDDGTTSTTVTLPAYELVCDEPVKVGTITTITTTVPEKVEGFDADNEVFPTADDIPTLSESEAAAMEEEGMLNDDDGGVFGDPSDLSNVRTVVEVYKNIEINTTPDSVFKFLLEE